MVESMSWLAYRITNGAPMAPQIYRWLKGTHGGINESASL
jgi:hypothetical protein